MYPEKKKIFKEKHVENNNCTSSFVFECVCRLKQKRKIRSAKGCFSAGFKWQLRDKQRWLQECVIIHEPSSLSVLRLS
jgi:hypothetical protein